MNPSFDLHILPTADDVVLEAVSRFVEAAVQAISVRGRFTVALSGGRTAAAFHRRLATSGGIDWAHVHVFFGDERCVAPDDPESNFGAAQETLLRHVPIPDDQIHRMVGELEPDEASARYAQTMRDALVGDPLDLVLLGMGGDGHTASIFPDTDTVRQTAPVVSTPIASQKPHVRRLTMTFPTLAAARQRLLLITGADKAEALNRALTDPTAHLPVQRLPDNTMVLCDADAAGRL